MRLVSIPQTAVDLLIQEHAKHPNSPICSLATHRRDIPSGQRGEPPQEDFKRTLDWNTLDSTISVTPLLPRRCRTVWT